MPGWKKDEWRKQVEEVSLVPPEKRPRTKDDDEDEEDWDMTLNTYKPCQFGSAYEILRLTVRCVKNWPNETRVINPSGRRVLTNVATTFRRRSRA